MENTRPLPLLTPCRAEVGKRDGNTGCVLLRQPASVFSPRRGSPQGGDGLHRMCTERKRIGVAARAGLGAELNYTNMKTAAEVCLLCAGSGWKPVAEAPERGVTRCDCQLRSRGGALIAAARIPKRYEHCELSEFTTDFPGADRSIALAKIGASVSCRSSIPRRQGPAAGGRNRDGQDSSRVGILKELIAARDAPAFFATIANC